MDKGRVILGAVAVVAIAAAVAGWIRPPVEREVVRHQDREVIRYVDREVVRWRDRDVVRHVRTVEPGGKTVEVVERTVEREASRATENEKTAAREVVRERVVDRPVRPDWLVTAGVQAPPALPLQPSYDLTVSRRILGPVLAGVRVSSRKEVGVSVSVEF